MIELYDILRDVMLQVVNKENTYWTEKFLNADFNKVHIAIMVEPYLSYILNGKKTIESRFSKKRILPFKKIESKDIVILKKSGGCVEGIFEAGKVCFFEQLETKSISELKESYNSQICGDDKFWKEKQSSKYASLIEIKALFPCDRIKVTAKNRKSWLSMDKNIEKLHFLQSPLL